MNDTQLVLFNGVYTSVISLLYYNLIAQDLTTSVIFTILIFIGILPTIYYLIQQNYFNNFDFTMQNNSFDAMSDIIGMLLIISSLIFAFFYDNYDSRVYVLSFLAFALFLSIIDLFNNIKLFSAVCIGFLFILILTKIGIAVNFSKRKIYNKYFDKKGKNIFKRSIIISDLFVIFACIAAFIQTKIYDTLPIKIVTAALSLASAIATGASINYSSNLL